MQVLHYQDLHLCYLKYHPPKTYLIIYRILKKGFLYEKIIIKIIIHYRY